MGRVAPYHSTNPSDPDVYHDQSGCPTGQQVPPKNRASGDGGLRKCKQCAAMG